MTTASEFRAKASEARRNSAESFERSDTDGFLTQWASDTSARKYDLAADIEDNGGVWEFSALFDAETGDWVPSKLIDTKYGTAWALLDADTGRFTGDFVTAFPKRRATMRNKGYTEGRALWPAKAVLRGSGTGLAGALSVQAVAEKRVPDQEPPVSIVYLDRFDEKEDR